MRTLPTLPSLEQSTVRRLVAVMLSTWLLSTSGCIIPAAIGGMAESFQRTGTTDVDAEYRGLEGHSFAVVVNADRSVQANEPGLLNRMTSRITDRVAKQYVGTVGTAFIPADRLLTVLYNNPQWPAMPPSELGAMLGVDRLVWIDIIEYRLNEPGNQYVWDGVAAGNVAVYDINSMLADEPVFERSVQVAFPDSQGFLRQQISPAAVTSELSNRFVTRTSWLFYDHEEPNVITY